MNRTASCRWQDSPDRYGTVTRLLHWGMAALFAWQFTGAALHAWDRDAAITQWFWASHGSLGVLLLVLVALRGIWGLENLRRRPDAEPGLRGRLSTAGHTGLYLLMIAVPVVAMMRSHGRGKGMAVFGLPLFEATGREVPALVAIGNALHGWLGWLLLALVAGHVAMVGVHRFVWRDQVAARMGGRR